MVRPIEWQTLDDGVVYKVFSGKSTDEKPEGHFANGSAFIEIDTGVVYFYDEEDEQWLKPGGDSNG